MTAKVETRIFLWFVTEEKYDRRHSVEFSKKEETYYDFRLVYSVGYWNISSEIYPFFNTFYRFWWIQMCQICQNVSFGTFHYSKISFFAELKHYKLSKISFHSVSWAKIYQIPILANLVWANFPYEQIWGSETLKITFLQILFYRIPIR